MTTPMGEPTLAELGRTLDRIEHDLGRRLDELGARFDRAVTAEVYEAHRQALLADVAAAKEEVAELRAELVEEKKERRADRRMYIGAILSLLVIVAGAFLLAALGLK